MLKHKRNNYKWIKSCAPKPRYFKLKHILSGKIVEGHNMSEWCRENNLPFGSQFELCNFLNKNKRMGYKLKTFHGYCLPEHNIKPFEIKNLVTNKIYKSLTIKNLSKISKISAQKLSDLFSNKRDRINEWARMDFNIDKIDKLPLLRNTKTGKTHRLFTSWKHFCMKNNLIMGAGDVLKKRGKHKDWIFENKG